MAEALMKTVLQEVRVCKSEALDIEKKFKEESFDSLKGSCEIVRSFSIPMGEINEYIDYMGEAYEGIGKEQIKKLKGIRFAKEIDRRIMDFNYVESTDDDMNRSRYGMVVLAKSGDEIGCMYVLYKMDFKIASSKMRSLLWGLFKWEGPNNSKIAGVVKSRSFHNFFRTKAMEEFYKEGVIDSVNYVKSLESC